MIIRNAQVSDCPALMALMNWYRSHTNSIWDRRLLSPEDMPGWLASHMAHPYAVLVAEEDGAVLGYASLSPFRPHIGYKDIAEDSVYVSPSAQGRGIGSALLCALLARAKENALHNITAWIDGENTGSVRFHERLGFYYIGTMPNAGTLDDKKRSVVILQYDIVQFGAIQTEPASL